MTFAKILLQNKVTLYVIGAWNFNIFWRTNQLIVSAIIGDEDGYSL